MGTWLNLAGHEAIVIALLAALGAGLATFIEDAQPSTRVVLAPALGLALAATVLVNLGQLISPGTLAWIALLPLTVVSLSVFLVRVRRSGKRPEAGRGGAGPGLLAAARPLLLLVVLLVALNYPLAHSRSTGPVAYRVADASIYVSVSDWLQSHSLADSSDPETWDRTSVYGATQTKRDETPVGAAAVQASVDKLLGWRASDGQSALTIALLIIVCLGAFAAVQEITRSTTWAAPLAGLLVAAFGFQLVTDGSQGALSDLVLVPALAVVGGLAIREQRTSSLVIVAVLFAGALSLYPPGVPALAAWAAVVVAAACIGAVRRDAGERDRVVRTAGLIALTAVMALAIAPVAAGRAIGFYGEYLNGQWVENGVPYKLPIEAIPGWLLQARNLYSIQDDPVIASSLGEFVVRILLPLALLAAACYGVVRYRAAWIVAAVVPVAAAIAYRGYLKAAGHDNATYAAERSLLIAAIAIAILLAVAVAALAARRDTAPRIAGVAVGGVALALAWSNGSEMASRFIEGGWVTPAAARQSLDDLKGKDGTLYLEGLGTTFPSAALEMPAIYNLVNEATPNRLAAAFTNSEYDGPRYLGDPAARRSPTEPLVDPSYRWVLTLLPGVETGRTPVARHGSIAVAERDRPLDVTVISGVAIDPPARNSAGSAWVQGQLTLAVIGAGDGPAWIRLEVVGPSVNLSGPPGGRVVSRRAGATTLCVPARGTGPVKVSVVSLAYAGLPGPPPQSRYATPLPNRSLKLAGMWAARRCTDAGAPV